MNLRELYLRYCEVTSFDLNGRIIYAFSVDYEPRQNGPDLGISPVLLGTFLAEAEFVLFGQRSGG
ncbi:Uncharacterised protein [Citrobacter koseri]|uniref:Uncharacterized protein n=1 Tax=Citrobacter koseri TaxID=545 RepID=A0A447UQ07_CITKO|nr:Uncharacterised protein [Citrobacter koseri]